MESTNLVCSSPELPFAAPPPPAQREATLRGPKSQNTGQFHFDRQSYIARNTAGDGLCALHALLGEKDSRGVYRYSPEDGRSPREHFIEDLRNIPRDNRNGPPSEPGVRTHYLAAMREFMRSHVRNWAQPPSYFTERDRNLLRTFRRALSEDARTRLDALHEDWARLLDSSEAEQNDFLFGEDVLNAYLAYIHHHAYCFVDVEILLQASIRHISVRIFAKNLSHRDVVPFFPLGDYLLDDVSAENVVYIWQENHHFSRCEPLQPIASRPEPSSAHPTAAEAETFAQRALRILSNIISRIVGWAILLSGMVYGAIQRSFGGAAREPLPAQPSNA